MSSSPPYHLTGHILSLAVHPEKKEMLIDKLRSPRLPWLKLITTGSNHFVLPAIYIRLQKAELLSIIPEIISEHLEKIYALNLERNKAIIRQSEEVAVILEKTGIQSLFLKGMGNIFDDLYSSPAERMVQDIDILVREDQWFEAVDALKKNDYRSRIPFEQNVASPRKHYPRLFRDDSTASIELHRFTVGLKYNTGFSTEDIWNEKIPVQHLPSCFVMADHHKVIHNFIHSQLEHQGHFYARVFIRNLYDQLLLSKRNDLNVTLQSWGQYSRKTAAYLELIRNTFYPEDHRKKQPLSKTGLYPLRHEIFLRSKLLSTGLQIMSKMFRSYIRKPFLAITDHKLRKKLINSVTDRSWYGRHIRSYRKYFGGR